MSETDERTAKVPELEKTVQTVREEFARWEKDSGRAQASLKQQLGETQARLKEVEADVPTNVRSHVRPPRAAARGWRRSRRWRTAAAPRAAREITAQQYNELLMGGFVVCKSCGRILYLPEAERQESGEDA